jgi:uncharacterized membrane protein
MNTSGKTYKLVLSAILGAIVLVMYFIPQVGFIRFGPILATTLHIPVILGAIYGGPYVGMAVGLFFGILSVTQAPADPTFSFAWATGEMKNYILVAVNAIIPRVLIGLTSAFVYKASKKIPRKTSLVALAVIAAGMLGYTIYKLIAQIGSGEGFSTYFMYIILIAAIIGLSIWIGLTIKNRSLSVVLAAGVGSLTNTILFLSLAYLFFKDVFAAALNVTRAEIANILVSVGTVNGTLELVVSIVLISAIAVAIKPKELIEQ